jgi:polyhydroxyalkanoate synthesis regulator phasin
MSRPLNKLDILVDDLVKEGRLNEEEAIIILAGVARLEIDLERASPRMRTVIAARGITYSGLKEFTKPL